jgi:hypothetical protein
MKSLQKHGVMEPIVRRDKFGLLMKLIVSKHTNKKIDNYVPTS